MSQTLATADLSKEVQKSIGSVGKQPKDVEEFTQFVQAELAKRGIEFDK